jgi:hypothetical protein
MVAESVIDLAHYDFRRNLIVDQNNPILVMKAWRDRVPPRDAATAGEACLGRTESEDALLWNVFRSLEKAGAEGYEAIARFFGTTRVLQLLFWGCDAEIQGEEQQLLSELLRAIDGRTPGTMTEPDLVVISEDEVLFVDCQLRPKGPGSPWRAREAGAERRWESYCQAIPQLSGFQGWRSSYQLIRNYVYAVKLAAYLEKKPKVTSLISEKNPEHLDLLQQFYEPFRQFDLEHADPLHTWQRMVPTLQGSSVDIEIRARILEKLTHTLEMAG